MSSVGQRRRFPWDTYDSVSLQRGGAPVEHKNGLDSVEQEFADPAQETQHVRVDQSFSLLITHGSLKLVDPDARVDGKSLAFHSFKPFLYVMFSVFPRT